MLESKLRHTERRLQANMITTIADIMKRIQTDLHKELQAAKTTTAIENVQDAPAVPAGTAGTAEVGDVPQEESESESSSNESDSDSEIDDNLSEMSFE